MGGGLSVVHAVAGERGPAAQTWEANRMEQQGAVRGVYEAELGIGILLQQAAQRRWSSEIVSVASWTDLKPDAT